MSSQAYTPGLKRKESYLVSRTRRLPIQGEVLVKEGNLVDQDTVVARTSVPGKPEMVNIAYALGVAPEEIERHMVKKTGETVKKGEALAYYASFFGLSKRNCPSPVTGTLEHISEVTGQAVVRELPLPVEIKAYIPGRIVKILPREGAVVQTPAAFIQGIFGVGGETQGELMMASDTPEQIIDADQISENCYGKVLVGGASMTAEALRKAVKVGVKGVVLGGIKDKDLTDFLGYEIGVAITGREEIGITLILTEAFGQMKMLKRTFDLLKKFNGKMACLNGATQIRAGVMRPEIIIPRNDITLKGDEDELFVGEGLIPGTQVRLIREPYFGAIGRVVDLPVELRKMESESDVRVLQAELEDGRRVIVPRANVEIIEE